MQPEYQNQIQREKQEANKFAMKIGNLERVEQEMLARLSQTQQKKQMMIQAFNEFAKMSSDDKLKVSHDLMGLVVEKDWKKKQDKYSKGESKKNEEED